MNGREVEPMRILFWGTGTEFSTTVLTYLISAGIRPAAVYTPGRTNANESALSLAPEPPILSELALVTPHIENGPVQIAWANQIPVFTIRELSAMETRKQLAAQQADVVVVACYPERIPGEILILPRHGFVNLHPSLLPDLRGPFPLFWTFRLGLQETGITLHRMDEGLDTGNILGQTAVKLPDGVHGTEADRIMGHAGASLVVRLLSSLSDSGSVQGTEGTFYGRPTKEEFVIPTSWSARRAFNFMRGTSEWGRTYTIQTRQGNIWARFAHSYTDDGVLPTATREESGALMIGFQRGILTVAR